MVKKASRFKAQRLDQNTPTPLRVESLINAENRDWNMAMVREVMTASDVTIVERIPLSRKRRPDKMIWSESMTGIFSVKSAYFTARRVLGKLEIASTNRDKIWKLIWSSKVAPKIKYFIWKLVQGIILTKVNLQKKGIYFH